MIGCNVSEFFSIRLLVVAQRKAEVNGKKYCRKLQTNNFQRNIFMLFR